MYGFLCCKTGLDVSKLKESGWTQHICNEMVQIWYNPLPKFENDHLFFETKTLIVLLDGVIFNIQELMQESSSQHWWECFLALYEQNAIPSCLRGSFRGLVYDKTLHRITAFTNQTGEKTVYYRVEDDLGLIIASHVNIIKALFNSNGIGTFEPNLRAHYELLLTGTILQGKTPFKGISRLTAGKLLRYTEGKLKIIMYHRFTNIPEHEDSLEVCIKKADILFRQAIHRVFHKSQEYGYKAECDLSGGLDSRFATWVAHELGYKDIINICYCVEGSLDHTISKQIAQDLGNEYFFLPMDSYIIENVDQKTLLNGGQVLYTISTGALNSLELIDTSNIGLCCTGLLGELAKADWMNTDIHTQPTYITNRKSTFYQLDVPPDLSKDYINYEQMNLYEYGFNAMYLSLLVRQEKVEAVSPLMDTDYLEYIFKIPLKYRRNYTFVERYMCQKYPQAARYVWQTVRMPVDKHFKNEIYIPKLLNDIKIGFIKYINKALSIMHINRQYIRIDDMNPFDTWYANDKTIQKYLDSYFRETIEYVSNTRLKNALSHMFHYSSLATDKIQVINVLAVWKNYLR